MSWHTNQEQVAPENVSASSPVSLQKKLPVLLKNTDESFLIFLIFFMNKLLLNLKWLVYMSMMSAAFTSAVWKTWYMLFDSSDPISRRNWEQQFLAVPCWWKSSGISLSPVAAPYSRRGTGELLAEEQGSCCCWGAAQLADLSRGCFVAQNLEMKYWSLLCFLQGVLQSP